MWLKRRLNPSVNWKIGISAFHPSSDKIFLDALNFGDKIFRALEQFGKFFALEFIVGGGRLDCFDLLAKSAI